MRSCFQEVFLNYHLRQAMCVDDFSKEFCVDCLSFDQTGLWFEKQAVEENRAAWPGFGVLKPLIPGG